MFKTTLIHHPATADTAAVVTIPARGAAEFENRRIRKITWSYNGVPTAGGLIITARGLTVYGIDITNGGPGPLDFDWGEIPELPTDEMVVTLAAGGSGVKGKLNVSVNELDL